MSRGQNGTNATVRDVARVARVSTATVSRALRFPDVVRPETRARIARAVERLNYVPHGVARALSTRRTDSVGAVIPTLDNAIYAVSTHSLQKALNDAGYALVLACHEFDPVTEAALARAFVEKGVDALVLVGTAHHRATQSLLGALSIPYVLTWSLDRSCAHPSVGFDNRAAGRMIADHLLGLGHRRIAMISGVTAGNDRARDRLAGVRAALKRAGLALEYLVQAPYTLRAGREALARVVAAARPTAVICGNDILGIGAIQEAQSRGIEVPAALSITGFDDMEIATVVSPALTTVRFPIAEIGVQAARYLVARLRGESPTACLELPLELVPRGSTAPPPAPATEA
jgi:LacI family transcriptional regulator